MTPSIDQMLRLLAERTAEHAIILLDPNGWIVWWNGAAERIFGITRREAVGHHLSEFFPADQIEKGMPEHELETAKADTPAEDDRWMSRSDGSRFWASGVNTALRDDSGRLIGFAKVLRNRTDLREQIETLQNRIDALVITERRKDVFLSTLSHELRNPLAPLSDAVRLIRTMGPASTETEFPLRVIERQVDSLKRLVDDLLDLARVKTGKVELQLEELSIQSVVQQALDSASSVIRTRRHQLQLLMPRVPILIEGDCERLVQVFVNILNNAAKFTPEGGRIWVKGTIEGDEAVVHIEDNGMGIPHDVLPRIFDLFTQAESARARSQGGLGIGLAVVQNLVSLHDGSVQVESDGPGKGSRFSVRLPLKPQPPNQDAGDRV